ncbi:rhodanese-like domain-containing protein [Ectobacillus sp. sgz5001026]|uniref:rhodanese-like domain-containing protein n=1 Tax=Ectobacillus sp. sgz5001026 TaxID=3242473 RepID=UPI0036D36C90
MSTSTIINIVLIALAAWLIVQRFIPVKGIKNITTGTLRNELGKRDKQYVDVRTPGEFNGNHIQGFKNIPLNQLASKSSSLKKEQEVIVICQSGMRSKQAAKLLKKQGFQNITNVTGGMSAWR